MIDKNANPPKFLFFIGPCVLESEQLALTIAGTLKEKLSHLEDRIDLYFKGSFDKANRTSINSYRGPGIDEGLRILEKVKKETGLKLITDFHYPDQAETVAKVVDVLQVPAFLCRQTDMIIAGAQACEKYGRILKVKKGQFLAPEDTVNIVEKAKNYIPLDRILLTERGHSFGYRQLVVDMSSFQVMQSFGVKTIHDATHCVQRPGGQGSQSGGNRQFVEVLAKAAIAAGANGIFMETHPVPDQALSDSATCLALEKIPTLVNQFLDLYEFSYNLSS